MLIDTNHLTDVNGYLGEGIHKVNGWCVPQLWQAIWPLVPKIGFGPVAEIGVFEGKFLIGLVKTFDPERKFDHAAIDFPCANVPSENRLYQASESKME